MGLQHSFFYLACKLYLHIVISNQSDMSFIYRLFQNIYKKLVLDILRIRIII